MNQTVIFNFGRPVVIQLQISKIAEEPIQNKKNNILCHLQYSPTNTSTY